MAVLLPTLLLMAAQVLTDINRMEVLNISKTTASLMSFIQLDWNYKKSIIFWH